MALQIILYMTLAALGTQLNTETKLDSPVKKHVTPIQKSGS